MLWDYFRIKRELEETKRQLAIRNNQMRQLNRLVNEVRAVSRSECIDSVILDMLAADIKYFAKGIER